MFRTKKMIALLFGLTFAGSLTAKPGDKAREMKERAEEAREKARRDSFKREREIKIAEKERVEKQIAVNKYVGAVQANGGVAPKWAEKSEGAKLYKDINQKFQASINQANAQVAAQGAASGMNAEQIKNLQAEMKKDIRAGGKIAPASTVALTKATNYKPEPPQAPKPNKYDQYSNDNFNDSWKGPLPSQANINALKAKYAPPKNPLLGMTPTEIAAFGKDNNLSAVQMAALKKELPFTPAQQIQQNYANVSRANAMHLAYCQSGRTTMGCEKFLDPERPVIVHRGPNGGPKKNYISPNSAEFAELNKIAASSSVPGYTTWKGDTSTKPVDAKGPCKGIPNCIVGNDGKAIKIDVKQAAWDAYRAGEHADYSQPGGAPAASYATATVQIVDKYGNRQNVPVDTWQKLVKSGQISDATFVNGINQTTDTRSAQQTQLVAGQNGGTATMLFNPSAGFFTDSYNAVNQAFGKNTGEAAQINTLAAMLTYTNGDMNLHAHSQGTGIASLAVDRYKAQGGNTSDLNTIMAAPIRNIASDVNTTYVVDNKFGMDTVNTFLNFLGGTTCANIDPKSKKCNGGMESNGKGPNQQTVTVTNATSAHNGANVIAPYDGSGANLVDGNWQTTIAPAAYLVSPTITIANIVEGVAINPYNPTPFSPVASAPAPSNTTVPVVTPVRAPVAPTVPTIRLVTTATPTPPGEDYIPPSTPTP